ncbi:MAG: hypothetical protein NC121_19880 [Blautia sp.]|nr:hypothetical protein [Blautia sp.]
MEKRNIIRNVTEFRKWVKKQLVEREISQDELARQMGTHGERISEALHGKRSGNKWIVPIIEKLGGEMEDFEDFLNAI